MLKSRYLFFFFVLIVTFSFAQSVKECTFSHSPGFYKSDFYLKISCDKGDLFYFDENNIKKNKKLFPDSLLINETTNFSLLLELEDSIIKLGAYSYFINFETDFKVVSISVDDDYLFNHRQGIYVKGPRAYFDTTSNHYRNVNWDRKWEKQNFIEIFDEEGKRIIAQNSGIRIFGGMTKYYPEKSLRIIARSKYGNNRFNADIFNKGKKEYKQFILRHSGNDYRKTRFKDALITSLATQSNLDVQAFSPTHLFVNSEYWGVYNIREKINKYYVDNNYDCGLDGTDILQGYRTVDEGTQDDYNKLLKFVEKFDLSIEENYLEVQKMMDTRNFANFWIYQIYSANHDARGNIRFWKSDSLDGKFRWIVYDTDLGFGPNRCKHNILKDFTNKRMTDWYNPRWATFLLRNLLENQDFENDFILQSSYILSSTLSKENVKNKINEFKILYEDEMKIHFEERKKFQKNQGNLKKWNKSIEGLFSFAAKRDDYSFIHLGDKFNLSDTYTLNISVENQENGKVLLNENELMTSVFSGRFFAEVDVPITIVPNVGYSFSGYEKSIIENENGENIFIHIVFTENQKSDKKVVINEIDYKNDCIEIFNQGNKNINLENWKIVDKNKNIYTINNGNIKPKSFAVFHLNSIEKIDSILYYPIDFGISSISESITLYDEKGNLVDRVSYDITEIKSSYSRNIPFDSVEQTTVIWENNLDVTIGSHNGLYTSLIYEQEQAILKQKKKRNILFISLGGVGLLTPILFFLIRYRRRKKSTLK